MNAPPNAPPSCPRRTDDSSGPRRCAESHCPLHLHRFAERGRGEAHARVRAVLDLDDTCAVDLSERARAAGTQLTLAEIGTVCAMSRQAAQQNLRSALRKMRLALMLATLEKKRRRFLTP